MVAVRCKRCGRAVSAGEVRYVSADKFYCSECYLAAEGSPRGAGKAGSKKYDVEPAVYERLVCGKCGFLNKFRQDSTAARRCSYCGADDLREQESTAAKLIQEADEDPFE